MAHVTLDGNSMVVKCDDGTVIRPGVRVDKTKLDNLKTLVSNAIDQSAWMVKADDKHLEEVSKLVDRVDSETAIIRGLLTPVQKKEAAKAVKTITAPSAPPKPKAEITPIRSEVDMKWLETELAECEKGDLRTIAAIYGSKTDIDKRLGAQFPDQLAAATRIVFAELSKIPLFTLNLASMSQARDYPAFSQLDRYVKVSKGLAGASPDVTNAANVYIRYFLLYLGAEEKPAYAQELGQLPNVKKAMDTLQQSMPDLKPLAGHMGTETVLAAALYIRRWNLEQKGIKPEQIPLWQSPETLAAAKQAPPKVQPAARDTTTRNWPKLELRW